MSELKVVAYLVTVIDGRVMITSSPICLSGHTSEPLVTLSEAQTAITEAYEKGKRDAETEREVMRVEFCRAIDHAILLNTEAANFLRCWNEGDWDGCLEFEFEFEAAPKEK
jgi:hypothetical protein